MNEEEIKTITYLTVLSLLLFCFFSRSISDIQNSQCRNSPIRAWEDGRKYCEGEGLKLVDTVYENGMCVWICR